MAPDAAFAPNAPNAPNATNAPMAGAQGLNIRSALVDGDAIGNAVPRTAIVDPDTTKPLLLLAQRVNDRGQIVLRVVDLDGKITERSLNAAGQLVVKKGAANARLLPLMREYIDSKGQYVRLVRDTFGAMLELDFTSQGKLFRVRVLNRPDADVTGAAAAAAMLPSAVAQTVNSVGQIVQHVVLTSGAIVERVLDATGRPLQQREVGSVLKLPALLALAQADGRLVVVARDPTGVLLEIVMRAADRSLLALRTIDQGPVAR
jgi:hypothetical protein